jgi:hypothetical protein
MQPPFTPSTPSSSLLKCSSALALCKTALEAFFPFHCGNFIVFNCPVIYQPTASTQSSSNEVDDERGGRYLRDITRCLPDQLKFTSHFWLLMGIESMLQNSRIKQRMYASCSRGHDRLHISATESRLFAVIKILEPHTSHLRCSHLQVAHRRFACTSKSAPTYCCLNDDLDQL